MSELHRIDDDLNAEPDVVTPFENLLANHAEFERQYPDSFLSPKMGDE